MTRAAICALILILAAPPAFAHGRHGSAVTSGVALVTMTVISAFTYLLIDTIQQRSEPSPPSQQGKAVSSDATPPDNRESILRRRGGGTHMSIDLVSTRDIRRDIHFPKVPVEDREGGPEGINSHWRESVFAQEIMATFYDYGEPNRSPERDHRGSFGRPGLRRRRVQADPYALPPAGKVVATERRMPFCGADHTPPDAHMH